MIFPHWWSRYNFCFTSPPSVCLSCAHMPFPLSCSPSIGQCLMYRRIAIKEHFSKLQRKLGILLIILLVLENDNLVSSIRKGYALLSLRNIQDDIFLRIKGHSLCSIRSSWINKLLKMYTFSDQCKHSVVTEMYKKMPIFMPIICALINCTEFFNSKVVYSKDIFYTRASIFSAGMLYSYNKIFLWLRII